MGMDVGASTGKKGQAHPEMNVTPLVDVVLVLLIIFMVVTPLLAKQFWVNLPDPPDPNEEPAPPTQSEGPIVLSVSKAGDMRLNRETVCEGSDDPVLDEACRGKLGRKINGFLRARGTRTVFFDAADEAPFGRAVQAMDVARESGARTIAVATEPLRGVND